MNYILRVVPILEITNYLFVKHMRATFALRDTCQPVFGENSVISAHSGRCPGNSLAPENSMKPPCCQKYVATHTQEG